MATTGDPWCLVHGQMLCDCSTSLSPGPMNVIDYGQYLPRVDAQPWPVQPLIPGRYHFTPFAPRLTDEDVERIARRLAELLTPASESP